MNTLGKIKIKCFLFLVLSNITIKYKAEMNKYLTKLAPFKTASIIPAVNAAQFSFPVEKKLSKFVKSQNKVNKL